MSGLEPPTLIALAVLGLVVGVGITAIGPGGVLATIGLFALTALTPAQVAGTAIVTHVATGALATAAYTRSGHLRDPHTRRTALTLAAAAVAGTPLGVLINSVVSGQAFGIVLGVFSAGIAALVWYRDRRPRADPAGHHLRTGVVAAVGFGVAVASGLVGVGGPLLAVPLLVTLGAPVLSALAAAQVQSVVIAGVGTLGYLAMRRHRLAPRRPGRRSGTRRSPARLGHRPPPARPHAQVRPHRQPHRARPLPGPPRLTGARNGPRLDAVGRSPGS